MPADPRTTRSAASRFLRAKIARVQVCVWARMAPGEDKDAVAAVCDGLLDALDEKDAAGMREPAPEEVACTHCGRTEEMDAMADSCERPDCPLNALFDAVPLVKDTP